MKSHMTPFLQTIAHGVSTPKKRHMRATWISTVLNIDWPSTTARGITPSHVDMQKAELKARFDEATATGLNAIMFQVSPTADAMYPSKISPWSAWLTGETNFTGVLKDSNGLAFDPLQMAIDLARERNIELHAWFNPYRVTHKAPSYGAIKLSSSGEAVKSLEDIRQEWAKILGNVFEKSGEYVKLGEERYVLDPAIGRDWVTSRVLEVVENYDIDGIQFDDYFYPADYTIDDTFTKFNTPEHNLITRKSYEDTPQAQADWRREQTEMMIRDVSKAIKAAKPWVKFGISPGGVWISAKEGNTGLPGGGFDAGTGSASTTSWSNYHTCFADTRKWVIDNLIDYLVPQIYWDWEHEDAPFGVVAEWWGRLFNDYGPKGHLRNSKDESTNAQLYAGLGLYRIDDVHEYLREEAYCLGNQNIYGSMIFTHKNTKLGQDNSRSETVESLRNTMWRHHALPYPMPHLGGIAPKSPKDVRLEGNILFWTNAEISADNLVSPRYFVIYGFDSDELDTENPANIQDIIPAFEGRQHYSWEVKESAMSKKYAITAVNRLHDESQPTHQSRR